MKRKSIVVGILWTALLVLPVQPLIANPDVLDSHEAETVIYLLELSEFKQEILSGGGALWGDMALTQLEVEQQNHVDMLLSMIGHYGIDRSEGSGASFSHLLFTENLRPLWTNWGSWMFDRQEFCSIGAYFEEMHISALRAAILETDEQFLTDTYSQILDEVYVHLLILVNQMMPDPYDYEPQLLSRESMDEVLALAIEQSSQGFEINAGLNDIWYNPAHDGEGFSITVFEDKGTLFLAWFTYDTMLPPDNVVASLGYAGQRWLTAQGSYHGTSAQLVVYSSRSGLFEGPPPAPTLFPVGTMELQFEDCNTANISYDLPGSFLAGSNPIERVASDNVARCEAMTQPLL